MAKTYYYKLVRTPAIKSSSHCSSGIAERLHDPLRTTYRIIRHVHTAVAPKIVLYVSVKAVNETMGENSLVPTKLVSEPCHFFSIISSDLPIQKERMEAFKSAKAEMNTIGAERHIQNALNRSIPTVDGDYS